MAEQDMGVRERGRLETTARIKRAASAHLATDGANLSMRSVARDVGMVSSAVYRYFESRDALLTSLIIDAYNDLGSAVEAAEAAVPRRDVVGRWQTSAHAVRGWCQAHPAEYGLLYGTPVPGYAAPQDTIGPAQRPVLVMTAILRDGIERGQLVPRRGERLPKPVRADLENIIGVPGFEGLTPAVLARGMNAWAGLFGAISFELFGRLNNAVTDYDAWFVHQLRLLTEEIGL
jgi:AcrR family transcriptional regulator